MVRFKYGYATADITLWSQLTQHRDSRHHMAAVENNTGKITDIQKYPGNAAMDLTQLNTLALERPLINNANVFVMNNHGTIHA